MQESTLVHATCCIAHGVCAFLCLFVIFEDNAAIAKEKLHIRGNLNVWIQANSTQAAHALPPWNSVDELVQDSAFVAQASTICAVEIDDEARNEQFANCTTDNFWACSAGALPPPSIVNLESTDFSVSIARGYQLLFVLYFAASAVQHAYVVIRTKQDNYYVKWVNKHYRWGPRWVEYAFSASLMSIIITLLTKAAQPDDLVHVTVITSVTMLLGYVCEQCDAAFVTLYLEKDNSLSTTQVDLFSSTRQDTYTWRPVRVSEVVPSRVATLTQRKNANLHRERIPVLAAPRTVNFDTAQLSKNQVAVYLRQLSVGCCVAAFVVQFFGLWSVSWIWRFNAGMRENQRIDDALFPGNICFSGPPSWVLFAIWGTVLLYTCFGFVMVYRLFSDKPYTSSYKDNMPARVWVAEAWYCALSLLAKVTLAAIFLFGVTERADCNVLPEYK